MLNIIAGTFSTGTPPVPPSSYESIATVTVGSGGSSSVTFSSIPGTYTHLQLRCISRSDFNSSSIDSLAIRFNSDTGSNYSYHSITGNGASAISDAASSVVAGVLGGEPSNTHTSGIFGGYVVDILDYSNTNKYTTIRTLGGVDTNNTGTEKGEIRLQSALWRNTDAVSSIVLQSSGGFTRGFVQYSHFALYGIKGA